MAVLIDLFKPHTSANDVWDGLRKIGLTKKNAMEWFTKRYSIENFKIEQETLMTLDDTIIVHGEGPTLIQLQNELSDRGINALSPAANIDNIFYNYITIHRFVEEVIPSASEETSVDESSTLNEDDRPQS